MSDSNNCLRGAANDIFSRDLPSRTNNIGIVADLSSSECTSQGGADEGRAMMQLIYDVAPGARLAFRTVYWGEADFAAGILKLTASGCDVIVDVIYLLSPCSKMALSHRASTKWFHKEFLIFWLLVIKRRTLGTHQHA
jgi:hypothetical protein